MSGLEEKILKILKKNKIFFEREKVFSDLRQGRYRFDFYCPKFSPPRAIEIQGPQHYKIVEKFHKTQADFKAAKERDRRKISYCLAHGIELYCVPYWDIDKIESLSDIFKKKYIAKTKWKNDEDWKSFQKK